MRTESQARDAVLIKSGCTELSRSLVRVRLFRESHYPDGYLSFARIHRKNREPPSWPTATTTAHQPLSVISLAIDHKGTFLLLASAFSHISANISAFSMMCE